MAKSSLIAIGVAAASLFITFLLYFFAVRYFEQDGKALEGALKFGIGMAMFAMAISVTFAAFSIGMYNDVREATDSYTPSG
jgi:hypothetical protein